MVDSARSLKRRAVGSAGLVAVLVAAGALSGASAAPEPVWVNPFAVNNGFTYVALGDLRLGNAELEGSAAAFGSVSTTNPNGYVVVHHVAGEHDYLVPSIDGAPVRILADKFVGPGGFDISNLDSSGMIAPDSPAATAVARFADVDGLTGSARGGGVGPAAGQDFLRVTNADGGALDLKTVPYAGADVADLQTEQGSVAAYFPGIQRGIEQANQCLSTLDDPELGLANHVQVSNEGGLVFVEGFATDRPNVLDYTDLAGATIKLDRADGYRPTAEAPLVVKVPAGTTTIGPLHFEGWSAQSGVHQSYARYILLDLSEVTGEVTIDGLEMGAVWAPGADLNFASGVTTNGQWLAQNIRTSGGGELHHHDFLAALPCGGVPDTPTEEPTTDVPTEEPTTDVPTEEPTTDVPTEEPTTDVPTEEPTTDVPTEEPTTDVPTEEPTTDVPTEEPTMDVPTTDAPTTEDPTVPGPGDSTEGTGDSTGPAPGGPTEPGKAHPAAPAPSADGDAVAEVETADSEGRLGQTGVEPTGLLVTAGVLLVGGLATLAVRRARSTH